MVQYAASDLYDGFVLDKEPRLLVGTPMYVVLGIGIALKVFLYFYCTFAYKILSSDSLQALAEDHFNDVISNAAAIATAAVAFHTIAWWVDPLGAILISLVIIYRYWVGAVVYPVSYQLLTILHCSTSDGLE